MDTSETYIKMCEKAKEIQDESFRYLMPDDMVAYRFGHSVTTIWRHEKGGLTTIPYSQTFIWLPQQDQLQDMINGNTNYTLALRGFDLSIDVPQVFPFSWEQLWLRFVMLLKYNKVWNGDEWTSG